MISYNYVVPEIMIYVEPPTQPAKTVAFQGRIAWKRSPNDGEEEV